MSGCTLSTLLYPALVPTQLNVTLGATLLTVTWLRSTRTHACAAVGTVVFSPMLGGPKAATTRRMRLMHVVTLTGVLVAAAWMIAQYCLQVRPYRPPDQKPLNPKECLVVILSLQDDMALLLRVPLSCLLPAHLKCDRVLKT